MPRDSNRRSANASTSPFGFTSKRRLGGLASRARINCSRLCFRLEFLDTFFSLACKRTRSCATCSIPGERIRGDGESIQTFGADFGRSKRHVGAVLLIERPVRPLHDLRAGRLTNIDNRGVAKMIRRVPAAHDDLSASSGMRCRETPTEDRAIPRPVLWGLASGKDCGT